MIYRRPTVYFPPFDYCDRQCGSCAIDKARCLLYQREADELLRRAIDGEGEPGPEVRAMRRVEECRRALERVEVQARRMGLDTSGIRRAASAPASRPRPEDPILASADAAMREVAGFLRVHGTSCPGEAADLRRLFPVVAPKLKRAVAEPADALEEASSILQAQAAHRAVAGQIRCLQSICIRRRALADEALDALTLLKGLREEIEARWLERPCALLVPVEDGVWWGPLRG
jgi:hypothetical protein